MSPEQARGEELDARTDLFSFGAVLYEMATRRMAFPGNTPALIHDGILNRTPTPLTQLNPNLPTDLERVVNKALEKDRKLRYQSAADIRTDLQRLKRDTASVRTPSAATAVPRVEGWQGIRWKVVGLAAIAVVALTAGIYPYFHHSGNATPTVHPAEVLPIQSSKQPVREDQSAKIEQQGDFAELAIRALLREWTESFKKKDLPRQVDCYAPVLETYFLRNKVSRDFVQADKSKAFSAIKEVLVFEISDITIEFASSSDATVRFRKKWDTSLASGKTFSGEEIEQLQLANLNGGWKIASEKELQVVNLERHSSQETIPAKPGGTE